MEQKLFIKSINRVQEFHFLMDKLFDSGISIIDCNEILELETNIVELLEEAYPDSGDVISWWIYEKDFGKDFKMGDWREDDGDVDLSTAEMLWKYCEGTIKDVVKCHKCGNLVYVGRNCGFCGNKV